MTFDQQLNWPTAFVVAAAIAGIVAFFWMLTR